MQIQAVVLFLLLVWSDLSCGCLGRRALLVAWRWEKCLHRRLVRLIQVIINPAVCDRQWSLIWIVLEAQWCYVKAFSLAIDSNRSCRDASIQVPQRWWFCLTCVQLEGSVFLKWHCKVADCLIIIQSGFQEQKPLEEKNVTRCRCPSLSLR